MIWELDHWKREILRTADRIVGFAPVPDGWSRASAAEAQQEIFWAAFALRLLDESGGLAEGAFGRVVAVGSYRLHEEIEEATDEAMLELCRSFEPRRWDVELHKIVNDIIHSWWFALRYDENDGGPHSILYVPQRALETSTRPKYILELMLSDFADEIRAAAALAEPSPNGRQAICDFGRK